MIGRVIASLAIVASIGCATHDSPVVSAPAFEHLDECVNPIRESMGWALFQGSVVEVTGPRTFRLRTDKGDVLNVSLVNIGEPVDVGELGMLRQMINGKRMSVMSNPSARDRKDITGEVQDAQGRDISRQLLRAGAAPFAVAPAYTLSEYLECLHRIAEREAKAEGAGIWRHQ